MPFGGLLTLGILGVTGAVGGSLIGANASETAAQQQTTQEQKALDFQEQEFGTEQANQAPFVSAGQSSVGQLMTGLQNGTFGPGSIAPFTAPTLAQAQQTPGYDFTQQQGEQGIERGAAAAGGAFTGGTLKSLATFDAGLADSTYQQVFNNALSGYQTQLQSQNQAFNQLSAAAGLGENAAANVGNTGAQAASTVGNTLTSIGATQAAGTIGAASAIQGGINGALNSATLPLYLQSLNSGNVSAPTPPGWNVAPGNVNATPPAQQYIPPAEQYVPPADYEDVS